MDKDGTFRASALFGAFVVHMTCTEKGCGEHVTVRRHRLCARHYAQRRVLARPAAPAVRQAGVVMLSACKHRPCTKDVYAHRLCRSHYMREWRRGAFKNDPTPPDSMLLDATDETSTSSSPFTPRASVTASCDEPSQDGFGSSAQENWCTMSYTDSTDPHAEALQLSVPDASCNIFELLR